MKEGKELPVLQQLVFQVNASHTDRAKRPLSKVTSDDRSRNVM